VSVKNGKLRVTLSCSATGNTRVGVPRATVARSD
jgi:hypothetical protein